MAPSDRDLLGDAAQPSTSTAGSGASAASHAGSSTGGSVGGAGGEGAVPTAGGDGSLPGAGGEGGHADFSALIPQAGLALWLMADHGIGEVESGVALWADFSLNEADAKQSLGSLQPKLVTGANGLPLLELDGVDDHFALPQGFADFSAGLSAFIIASEASDQDCPSLLHLSNEAEVQDIEIGRYLGAVHYEVADQDVTGIENTFGIGPLALVGVVHAPSKPPELRLNGLLMTDDGSVALPEVKPRTNNFIGRSLYSGCEKFHGRIGEVILYSRALSTEDRLAVELYLQGKWSYEPPVKTKPGPGEIPAAN